MRSQHTWQRCRKLSRSGCQLRPRSRAATRRRNSGNQLGVCGQLRDATLPVPPRMISYSSLSCGNPVRSRRSRLFPAKSPRQAVSENVKSVKTEGWRTAEDMFQSYIKRSKKRKPTHYTTDVNSCGLQDRQFFGLGFQRGASFGS